VGEKRGMDMTSSTSSWYSRVESSTYIAIEKEKAPVFQYIRTRCGPHPHPRNGDHITPVLIASFFSVAIYLDRDVNIPKPKCDKICNEV
jgi:hypothetical protein